MRWCQDTPPLDLARCADTGGKGTALPNPADIQQIEQLSLIQPREYTIYIITFIPLLENTRCYAATLPWVGLVSSTS